MLTILLCLGAVGLTLLVVAFRPELITRPSAFREPPTPALLRAWGGLILLGALLLGLGFWQGRQYGPGGCAAVEDLAQVFGDLDLTLRANTREVSAFTQELMDRRRRVTQLGVSTP